MVEINLYELHKSGMHLFTVWCSKISYSYENFELCIYWAADHLKKCF